MTTQHGRAATWPLALWWVLVSMAAWMAGVAMGAVVTMVAASFGRLNEDRVAVLAVLLCVGIACAVAQVLVLRGIVPGAPRWIPLTIAGYLAAVLVVVIANASLTMLPAPVLFAILGGVIGLAQWLALRGFSGSWLWPAATAAGFTCFAWLAYNPAHSLAELVLVDALLAGLAAAPPGAILSWLVGRPRLGIV